MMLDRVFSKAGIRKGHQGIFFLTYYHPIVPLPHLNTITTKGIPPILMRNSDEAPGMKEEVFNMENDGLGAFRPSTSINDLSSLLGGSDPLEATPQKPNVNPQDATPAIAVETNSSGKKRERANSSTIVAVTPAKKKRANGVGAKSQVTTSSSGTTQRQLDGNTTNGGVVTPPIVAVVGTQFQKLNANKAEGNGDDNTPDPLTLANRVVSIEPTQVLSTTIRPTIPTGTVAAVVPKQTTLVAQAAAVAPLMNASTNQLLPSQRLGKEATVISSPKTEEAFKGVAQAAVTNLILNAGNSARIEGAVNEVETDANGKPIDTSSAHVAALTSNNWVAACAASISDAPPGTAAAAQAAALAAASDPAAAKAARARRATLTADERARQNRDRNREHARNTRLRKKAYVEELKRTLTELVNQRDATELERRHEKQRDIEVREVRYRVMEEFLKLRARGSETNLLARWVAILEDGFTLTLPRTEYRIMSQNQLGDTLSQNLKGATECLDDASKLSAFVNSIGLGNVSQIPNNAAVRMTYHCDRKKFMMDDVNAVLDWTMSTSGCTARVRLMTHFKLVTNYFLFKFTHFKFKGLFFRVNHARMHEGDVQSSLKQTSVCRNYF